MTRQRHKTLMVCANCHDHIHTGPTHRTPHGTNHMENPLRRQPARRVRREATPEKDLHHRHLAAPPTHPSKSPDGGRISIGRSTSTARSSTSSSARGEIWKPPFFTPALEHRPAPTEVTTDRAHAHPRVIEELPPAACHHRAIHEQPDRSRSQPPEIPTTTDARSQTAALHPSNQHTTRLHPNLHRGHYELDLDLHPRHRIPPRIR